MDLANAATQTDEALSKRYAGFPHSGILLGTLNYCRTEGHSTVFHCIVSEQANPMINKGLVLQPNNLRIIVFMPRDFKVFYIVAVGSVQQLTTNTFHTYATIMPRELGTKRFLSYVLNFIS